MVQESPSVSLTTEDGSPVSSPRRFTGKGRAVYGEEGAVYEGDFVNGQKEGFGVYVHPNGDRYEGEYKGGKRNGRGKIIFADGGFFHGDFVEGQREGLGTRKFANGDFYYGGWKNGKYEGQGTYCFHESKQKLKGDWVSGSLASGEWEWRDGTVYKGSFCCSKPQGAGSWAFPSGTEVFGVYRQLAVPVEDRSGEEEETPDARSDCQRQQVFLSWETHEAKAIAS